jgi:hypothetical protein
MIKAFVLSAAMAAMLIPAPAQAPTPAAAADALLAADRAFSAAAKDKSLVDALMVMFRPDVTMTSPKGFIDGAEQVRAALLSNPANPSSRVEWTPLRAGVSADNTQGFTFGLMTIRLEDGTARPAKYMAYWIKGAEGWRVAAYKRAPAAAGEAAHTVMAPSLPAAIVPATTDRATLEAHAASLTAAEQAFSDEAQRIGVGPAFVKWGRDDAANMGPPTEPGFTIGAAAIGGAGNDDPSAPAGPSINWNAERVIVASSGDLGVTFGHIKAADGSRPPSAFFTIWRRDSPASPWRYIAE